MRAGSHGTQRAEAAESQRDPCQAQLHAAAEGRTPGENHGWCCAGDMWILRGFLVTFDKRLVQHELRKASIPAAR